MMKFNHRHSMQGGAQRSRDMEPRFGLALWSAESGVPARAFASLRLGWNDEILGGRA
jgi:hypothetical protein